MCVYALRVLSIEGFKVIRDALFWRLYFAFWLLLRSTILSTNQMANWTLRGLSHFFPFRILDTHRHRLPPFTHINPYIFIIAGQHYGTDVLVCQTRTPLWQWFQKYTHFPLRNTRSLTETYFSLLSCNPLAKWDEPPSRYISIYVPKILVFSYSWRSGRRPTAWKDAFHGRLTYGIPPKRSKGYVLEWECSKNTI